MRAMFESKRKSLKSIINMPRTTRDKIISRRRGNKPRNHIGVNENRPHSRAHPPQNPRKEMKQYQKSEQANSHVEALHQLANKIALHDKNDKYIVLTVGNLGYMSLLINWWLSLNKNTNLAKHSMILTYDNVLIHNLEKKLPFCNTAYIPYTVAKIKPSEKATAFKKSGWDDITRFKLKAIHHLLEKGYTVYYVDPDVYVINNSLERLNNLIKDETKMLIQQGKPFCSGVIYAPPNDITRKLFNPGEWTACGTDDEHYIIHFFTKKYPELRQHIRVLSLDRFPNGLKWKYDYTVDRVWKGVKNNEIDLLHFNYVAGIENKISKMRQYKMWHKQMTIVDVPSHFQPDLNQICLRKNKSVYPPHQAGPQIEKYTYNFMTKYLKSNSISSDYDYLPIFWTGVSLNDENPRLKDKLKAWLRNFIKRYPTRKCWTVVQHCKGIQRTCGLVLPKNWVIFSTSDANAIKLNNEIKTPSQIDTVNFISIHRRKIMHWHKTGFGRQTEKPPPERYKTRHTQQRMHTGTKSVETVDNNPNPLKESKNLLFYTKNHISIPLLSSIRKASKNAKWTGKRKLLASFIGDLAVHPIRGLMRDSLSKRSDVCIQGGKYKFSQHVNRFDELMLNSTFALCPRGYGNTSFRLVEAMQFGAIPVYISDVFTLPYNDKMDWNKIAVLIEPNQFPKIYQILKDIEDDQSKVDEYRNNIKRVFKDYFTMEGCCKNIIGYITE